MDGRFINPPFLLGSGGVELAGKEMTVELQQQKAFAMANAGQWVPLPAKGVSFGKIIYRNGMLDTSHVKGIEEDLVVRPFGRKGEFATVRGFDVDAMRFHFGMEPVEGVGPGDPELITLKALRLLHAAPVIAYPAPDNGDSLARAIVAPHLPGGQTEIAIRIPMLIERAPLQEIYDRAAVELAIHLDEGRDVAVICEGDPFFYGSFMYLFGRMAERFPVEVVPGVSSLTACAATLGAPLAARNDVLTVLPAPLPEDELERRLALLDAAAIIKVGRHFAKLRGLLQRLGLADQARYIEHATMTDQRILALDQADKCIFHRRLGMQLICHHRLEAIGSIKCYQLRAIHQGDTITVFRFIHKMRRDHHGHTFGYKAINMCPKFPPSNGINTRSRLI